MAWETLAIFVVSLLLLSKGSHWVIDSAIKLAAYLGISGIATGYIFISFGTSLPDFMVSIQAAMAGKSEIAFGDVLGSSIANICLVLGIAALVKPLYLRREQTLESAELLLIASIIPLFLLYLQGIGSLAGIVLLLIFILYVSLVLKKKFSMDLPPVHSHSDLKKTLAFFFAGLAVVIISARYVISTTVELATSAGIPEGLIGMTLIAFGTTLPELAVDFVAIRRGHTALAIGDILGSGVINLTLVLGSVAIVHPVLNSNALFGTALIFLVAVNFFLWYMLIRHEGISRNIGLIFLLGYVLFIMVEILVSFGLLAKSPTGALVALG